MYRVKSKNVWTVSLKISSEKGKKKLFVNEIMDLLCHSDHKRHNEESVKI